MDMESSPYIKPERMERLERFISEHNDCIHLLRQELYGDPSDIRIANSLYMSMAVGRLRSPKDTALYRIALWLSKNEVAADMPRNEVKKVISEGTGINELAVLNVLRGQVFKKTKHILSEKDWKTFKARAYV